MICDKAYAMISRNTLRAIGPGLIVAATGVGAGDLAAASMAGSKLGLAVLWAVVVGAFFKFVLNEGLARWQLATGSTLLEGAVAHLGRPVQWLFLVYLVVWSFLVAAALMSAIGVTSHAMLPLAGTSAEAGANRQDYLRRAAQCAGRGAGAAGWISHFRQGDGRAGRPDVCDRGDDGRGDAAAGGRSACGAFSCRQSRAAAWPGRLP